MYPARLRLLLVVTLLLLAPAAFAQRGPGGGRGPMDKDTWLTQNLAAMTEAVELTTEQQDAIRPLLAAHFDEMQELRQSLRGQGREGMRGLRQTMQERQQALDAQIVPLLSEAQVEKLRVFREEQRRQMQERFGGRPGAGQ